MAGVQCQYFTNRLSRNQWNNVNKKRPTKMNTKRGRKSENVFQVAVRAETRRAEGGPQGLTETFFFFWTRRKGGGGLTTTQGVRAQVWNWWGGQMDPTLLFVFFLYISSSWGEESKETVRCLFYFFREEFFFFFWRGFNGQNRITIFILRPFRLSLSPVYKYTSRALTS